MKTYRAWKAAIIVFLMCAAFAISSSAQTLTTLHNFAGPPNDGAASSAGLVQGTDGNFYGTTTTGGTNNKGTVFKITPSGTVTVLHSFAGPPNDGNGPTAELIQATDGNFYGTTEFGGSNGTGTVFKITPSGTLTTLYSFACSGGCGPLGGLIQASDGNFYGTTSAGGTHQIGGTVFKITPSGTETMLYSFACSDGCYSYAGVIQGSDGNFYGTTSIGGANNDGTVFKITPHGTLTFLHTFQRSDGADPYAGLIQASDGNFYGTTYVGGANDDGTVFKITPQGALTTLHSFTGGDGNGPRAGLVQASDGNFYGTTSSGGANDRGTLFEITPQGALTTLHSFNGGDGSDSEAGLVQASDGSFYGTAAGGGSDGHGTVFKLQLPVTLTVSVAGDGSVTSTDGFINCPGSCTHTYDPGTPVTLNAAASSGWVFAGWTGACTGVGACNLTMTDNLSVTGVFLEPGHGLAFNAVTPCRLVDTRTQNGGGGPIQGGTFQSFNLPQLAQSKGCADLSTAASYSLNVTVVPHGSLGYITIWPTGEAQPTISTMNSLDGRIKANAAIVPAGTNSAVSVYVSNTTDVVLDIDGYFAATTGSLSDGGSSLQFYPLTPCRVLDTRNTDGPLGGPYLKSGVERDFPVLSSNCNIPSSAQAYSMNFTVVPYEGQPLGYLTVWPEGGTRPVVSTLNNLTATIVANAAIVPAGTNDGIATYPSGNTQISGRH